MYIEDHPYCFRLGGSSRNIQKMIDEKIPFCVPLPSKKIPFLIYEDFPSPEEPRGIVVQRMPCHLGGCRYEFVCPTCRKKYRKMYLAPCIRFICRNCHGLSYRCKSLSKIDRLYDKLSKIYERYGFNPHINKRPFGIHRKTYSKFLKRRSEVDNEIFFLRFAE